MIRHLEYTRARLAQASLRLRERVYAETRPLDELVVAGPVGRIGFEEAQELDYRPAELGERFGPLFATYWLRGRAAVPEAWAGRRVDLLWDSGSEAALWLGGEPSQGLNRHHGEAVLRDAVGDGETIDFAVELACNGLFGRQDAAFELRRAELGAFDPEAWRLFFDFETLRALEAGEGVDPSWAGALRAGLEGFCDGGDEAILAELYAHRNGTHAHQVAAIGHAHIDTAWLWPLDETYRKCVRTFSTQLSYLDEYPEHRFACSQAVQYAWVKERNPGLWQRLREHVADGGFLPVGGSWVEPDCNLPSGEALVRHFLHGQRFFEREFGHRCREFWSPDAFGYSGQLPQILREVGITRFLTQKLSWNRFNRPEQHTFTWQGVDGSEVLGHFPPADTYSSEATVSELLKTSREYLDHDHSGRSLLLFGHGDGGGPTRAMLETLRRAGDLQGLPRTRLSTSDEFFEALEAEPDERPVVVGELYFEYHRGVYTSQARTKRLNRRCEQALHDAEFLACLRGGEYPRAELDRLWRLLLLNQFHDILPGSSIREVHERSERDLAAVLAGAEAVCGPGTTPVNTTGFPRREVVSTPDGELRLLEAPPYGAGEAVSAGENFVLLQHKPLTLENGRLRAQLGPDGTVVSLVDKTCGREALSAPGNRLELYEDLPVAFDAWDVDPAHLRTRRDAPSIESYEVVTESPLRVEVAFERHGFRLVVRLDAGSRRLEFRCEADWRERHTMLKVCFPLAVRAPTATYEMPFGYAERPTHYSTSWDRARYEVPGHRFADLSEHGFGVALLTDSKYGYSCHGQELRISLLRSPTSPDPEADQGRHEFAYAVVPHAGGWRESGVLAEAHRFNAPFRWADAFPAGSFAAVDDPNLVLDTVKRAEDSGALVLRLYEAHGARGDARLRVGAPSAFARLANALEEDCGPLDVQDGEVLLPYRPHQLLTVKLS